MADASSPTKRALLIGIDAYDHLAENYQLQGCRNDAEAMYAFLTNRLDFPEDNVALLTSPAVHASASGRTDRAGILAALDALVEATESEDVVVVHFSGHGSQMPDEDGDEADGYDETIMPSDSGRTAEAPATDITDDELRLRFQRLGRKTEFLTLIFDCCHSGSITRDAFGEGSRSIAAGARMGDKADESEDLKEVRRRTRETMMAELAEVESGETGPSGWLPLGEKYVLLAGCRDEESSYEYREKVGEETIRHGSLTYHLLQEMSDIGPDTTYRDVFQRVAPQVTSYRTAQHPQAEGRLDRQLFGLKDIVAQPFLRVLGRADHRIGLAGGAAIGVRVGSRWAIHAPDTKTIDDGREPLAVATVTRVAAVQSEADLDEDFEAVNAQCRAFLLSEPAGGASVTVQLDPRLDHEQVRRLKQLLAGEQKIVLTDSDDAADYRIYLLEARDVVQEGDPAPQIGALAGPMWVTIGRDGQVAMPPRDPGSMVDLFDDEDRPFQMGAEELLVENLVKWANYRFALGLKNTDSASRLAGKLKIELLRQDAGGDWVVAEPENAGGRIVFEVEEKIVIRVTNLHDKNLYIYPFDFDMTGAILYLRDLIGEEQYLKPGASIELGRDDGGIPLYIADEYPFGENPYGERVDEGNEVVKVFASTLPTSSFGFLAQDAVRSLDAEEVVIPELAGLEPREATRAMRVKKKPPSDGQDWTAVTAPFILRRRTSLPLPESGESVAFGSTSVSSSGLSGEISAYDGASDRGRAQTGVTGVLADAMRASGVRPRQTFRVSAPGGERAATRSVGGDTATLTLETEPPASEEGQFVISTDEAGIMKLDFGEPIAEERTRGAPGGEGRRRYSIPAEPAEAEDAPTRSVASAIGMRVLNVVVFPKLQEGFGRLASGFAERFESQKWPYRIRTFSEADAAEDGSEADGALFEKLSGGRALLLLHGPFVRSRTGFGGLDAETLGRLHARYDGRVFAFDHHTVSHDPERNAAELLKRLPGEIDLDIDVLAHSRGGLVGRALVEKSGELSDGSRRVKVGRVIMAGTPNAGTPLADSKYLGDFLNTYINLFNLGGLAGGVAGDVLKSVAGSLIPPNGVTESLELLLTIAKLMAVGAIDGLDGIACMKPSSEWLNSLDAALAPEGTRYYALSSKFDPQKPSSFKALIMDQVSRGILGQGESDLIVPSDNVTAFTGSDTAIAEGVVVSEPAVSHFGYFANPTTREKILGWLD